MLSKVHFTRKGTTWLERWIAHKKTIKQTIKVESIKWSEQILRLRMGLAGHMQRHKENLSWFVSNYKTISWWKERQKLIQPGNSYLRHKGRFYHKHWESDIYDHAKHQNMLHICEDHFIATGKVPKDWRDIALDRNLWKKLTTYLYTSS